MNEKQIVPRGKWVLIKPVEKESLENEHGLLLPANEEREQKAVGVVCAVDNQTVSDVKVDDSVIYGTFAGENVELEGQDYKLLHEEDIIAFLK